MVKKRLIRVIPKPVWAVGFALEQTLRDATLAVFSYMDFKVASAYYRRKQRNVGDNITCWFAIYGMVDNNVCF
ncbi:MAG: hypothetical protein LBH59_00200 [Planctomycetaceae bacterium]|nr:hypothetical protein [Planctomycetaceae bacterium]